MNLFTYQKSLEYKKALQVNCKQFDKVDRRTEKNGYISYLYRKLSDEIGDESLQITANRVFSCSRYYEIDYYVDQKVKDVQRTYFCHNRFCDNCQNAYAVQREFKYTPVLDQLSKLFHLYHIVFTVPNCYSDQLLITLDQMQNSFGYINRYLNGNLKIKGIDFLKYGYSGCIRALEITKSKKGDFHPHFHCLFLFRNDLSKFPEWKKHNVNSYSFDNPDVVLHKKKSYGTPQRYFSDFEILLQKIWRLKFDGIKVTRDNLEGIKEGYSVIVDPAKGRYHQVFKYATKGLFKKTDGDLNYRDFVNLHFALQNRRIIQGYGVFFHCDFEEINLDTDKYYNRLVAILRSNEYPIPEIEKLDQILTAQLHAKDITYISRQSMRRIMEDNNDER